MYGCASSETVVNVGDLIKRNDYYFCSSLSCAKFIDIDTRVNVVIWYLRLSAHIDILSKYTHHPASVVCTFRALSAEQSHLITFDLMFNGLEFTDTFSAASNTITLVLINWFIDEVMNRDLTGINP